MPPTLYNKKGVNPMLHDFAWETIETFHCPDGPGWASIMTELAPRIKANTNLVLVGANSAIEIHKNELTPEVYALFRERRDCVLVVPKVPKEWFSSPDTIDTSKIPGNTVYIIKDQIIPYIRFAQTSVQIVNFVPVFLANWYMFNAREIQLLAKCMHNEKITITHKILTSNGKSLARGIHEFAANFGQGIIPEDALDAPYGTTIVGVRCAGYVPTWMLGISSSLPDAVERFEALRPGAALEAELTFLGAKKFIEMARLA